MRTGEGRQGKERLGKEHQAQERGKERVWQYVDGSMEFRIYFKTTVRFLKSQMLSNPHFHHGHPAITIREKSHYNATS